MGEEQKTVSGKRVLLALLGLAVVMQVLLVLFILDVRARKPATIGPATQTTLPTTSTTSGPRSD